MTEKQIARKHAALLKRAQAAQNSYSLARGRRRDKGGRIQSAAETRASYRASSALTELRNFEQEHDLKRAEISY